MQAEPLPRAAEARNITAALRRSGVLGDGWVRDVVLGTSFAKQRSLTLRLLLTYDGPAADGPRSLILKMGQPDSAGRWPYANQREIAFYRDIVATLPERITPRCFEATGTTEASPWYLLLEDLTDSHVIATEHPLPPTPMQCDLLVRTWARLHASMWDDPRLATVAGWPDAAWDLFLRGFAGRFARFMDRFGHLISPERLGLYERLLDRAPGLLSRYREHRNLTLIHGDAHPWNCFLPRQDDSEDARIFDWESWSIDTGATDIAYMMAMLWYPDLRRRAERPLQDVYHAELLKHGVSGYDRQALNDDYRLAVLLLLLRPIGQAAISIPPRVWWPNLERIMLAVDDLGCRDLLA